jgi:hypothetical protein
MRLIVLCVIGVQCCCFSDMLLLDLVFVACFVPLVQGICSADRYLLTHMECHRHIKTEHLLIVPDPTIITWLSISNQAVSCGADWGLINLNNFTSLRYITVGDTNVCKCLCSARPLPDSRHCKQLQPCPGLATTTGELGGLGSCARH